MIEVKLCGVCEKCLHCFICRINIFQIFLFMLWENEIYIKSQKVWVFMTDNNLKPGSWEIYSYGPLIQKAKNSSVKVRPKKCQYRRKFLSVFFRSSHIESSKFHPHLKLFFWNFLTILFAFFFRFSPPSFPIKLRCYKNKWKYVLALDFGSINQCWG